MVWILVGLAICLDESLIDLARKVRTSVRRVRSPPKGGTYYRPGSYDLDGVSFTLSHPLVGRDDPSVVGYASTSAILALISKPMEAHAIFVGDDQQLLRIVKMFTTHGDVCFYNVTVEDSDMVFENLRIVFPRGEGNSSQRTRHVNSPPDWLLTRLKTGWDTSVVPLPTMGSCYKGISGALMGANLEAVAWAKYKSVTDPKKKKKMGEVKMDFAVQGKVGIGLYLFKWARKPDKNACQEIMLDHNHTIYVSIANYDLQARLSLKLQLKVEDVHVAWGSSSQDPGEIIQYFRAWDLDVSQSAVINSQGRASSRFSEPRVGIRKDTSDYVRQNLNGERPKGIAIQATPKVAFWGELVVFDGTKVKTMVRSGFHLDVGLNFKTDADVCGLDSVLNSGTFSLNRYVQTKPKIEDWTAWQEETVILKEDIRSSCLWETDKNPVSPIRGSPLGMVEERSFVTVKFVKGQKFQTIGITVKAPSQAGMTGYIVISVPQVSGLSLLNISARELVPGKWLVPLDLVRWLDGTFTFVLVRSKTDLAEEFPVQRTEVFYNSRSVFCGTEAINLPVDFKGKVGCAEPLTVSGVIARDWVALVTGLDPIPAVSGGSSILKFFEIPAGPGGRQLVISARRHVIGVQAGLVLAPKTFRAPFGAGRNSVGFEAQGAKSVICYCGQNTKEEALVKNGEVFTGLECADTALVVARNSWWQGFNTQEDDVPEDTQDEWQGETLMMVAVAVGAFVGSVIVAIVGVFIYRRRYNAKAKSGSSVSNESSDEVREESLIDGTE